MQLLLLLHAIQALIVLPDQLLALNVLQTQTALLLQLPHQAVLQAIIH